MPVAAYMGYENTMRCESERITLLVHCRSMMLHQHQVIVCASNAQLGVDLCLQVTLSLSKRPHPPSNSNMTKEQYLAAVDQTKEHIQAGDVFQLVLSQRFERHTRADPFEIYRCCLIAS